MRKILLIITILIYSNIVSSQRISNPSVRKSDISYCQLLSIECNWENTIAYFKYTAPNIYEDGGWVNAIDNFFIRDNTTGQKYYLTKANNIPISPKKYYFRKPGETLNFSLEFQPLPKSCNEIDIIESLTTEGFNFYGVKLENTSSNDNLSNNSFGFNKSVNREFRYFKALDNSSESEEWTRYNVGTKFKLNSEKKELTIEKEDIAGTWLTISLTEFVGYDSDKNLYVYGGFIKESNSSCGFGLSLDGDMRLEMHKEDGALIFIFSN